MRKIIEAVLVDEGVKSDKDIKKFFDLYDSDEIGLLELGDKVDAWLDRFVKVGDSFRFGRNRVLVNKSDSKVFTVTDKKGPMKMQTKELREWIVNNLTHDLSFDDWEDVGISFE